MTRHTTAQRMPWLAVLRLLVVISFLSGPDALSISLTSDPPAQRDLERVADASILEITTVGRRSGEARTTPIWFVYEDGRLYIQSGNEGNTNWYRNLKKTPRTTVTIGTLTFEAAPTFISGPAMTARIHALFRSKYLRARLAGLIGAAVGHGRVVELTPVRSNTDDQTS